MNSLKIGSPKRSASSKVGWQGFFPYYAGFSENFAQELIASCGLEPDALVWDPWNGSGTTTFAAASLGISARGLDINPVMVIVAKARLLPYSETDALVPLASDILNSARRSKAKLQRADALLGWFDPTTATHIRNVERSLRKLLVGNMTITNDGTNLSRLSSVAAALYVALFTTCRSYLKRFTTSNPTWMRIPDVARQNVIIAKDVFESSFRENVAAMAAAVQPAFAQKSPFFDQTTIVIDSGDTTEARHYDKMADMIVTSPPYCTRIDYAAATRIELAIVEPWQNVDAFKLSRLMIGSTRVPKSPPSPCRDWGGKCISFLRAVRDHPSKASKSYYLKNHLDYFDKMSRSLRSISKNLRREGVAVFVVQDSYYKEVFNPLPDILSEMASQFGLREFRRDNFNSSRSMSGINRASLAYREHCSPTESVICFEKQ